MSVSRSALGLVALAILGCAAVSTLAGDPLSGLLGQPTLSTSFKDARNEIVLPDDFNPPMFARLDTLPRGPTGGFMIQSGLYEMSVRSYCLHEGTHGPSKGEGYLNADLKGERATFIANILRRSSGHPEISQSEVQTLIWAVLARAKLSTLSPQLVSTLKLLSPQELLELDGGALGQLPDEVYARALDRLPGPLREVFKADAQLRDLLSMTQASYESLEQVAVLAGEAVENSPSIPASRWSRHPKGFYIRYQPDGYRTTRIQIYAPDPADPFTRHARNARSVLFEVSIPPSPPSGGVPEYEPWNDVAVPAQTDSQRLGMSDAPSDSPPPQPKREPCDVDGCLKLIEFAHNLCVSECKKETGEVGPCTLSCEVSYFFGTRRCKNSGGCSNGAEEEKKECKCVCSWPNPKNPDDGCVAGPNKTKDLAACRAYCEGREPGYPCTRPVNAWCSER
jgi:hypothetical protein